jgi:DNA-3-methyladenine glycosylase
MSVQAASQNNMNPKLPEAFFAHTDVLAISRALLGKILVTNFAGEITAGMIVETEAYMAPEDKASHAYQNRRTKRTETMFGVGGVAYVYLCYGMHHLFNIVTGPKDVAHAVLIRAIQPISGIETMLKRRGFKNIKRQLTAGPGVLSKALGITIEHDGHSLISQDIWVEDHGVLAPEQHIVAGPRVGVAYAAEHAALPWRFRLKDSIWTSG